MTETKYSTLASQFIEKGYAVHSVCYHDSIAERIQEELKDFDAILVWVNPIEHGSDRKMLDKLLRDVSAQGHFVSAHPDVISKIGTKEILYKIRHEEFGMDVKCYSSFEEFERLFFYNNAGIRILKQYRGNGGNGVFKINTEHFKKDRIGVTPATGGEELIMTSKDFFNLFKIYFDKSDLFIDQAWNPNIINGMVRCYVSGYKVAGFGYQEVNALYPVTGALFKKPSQRFYYSENYGLFRDLRNIMENSWIKRLQEISEIKSEMLPVIWDADFFINTINEGNPAKKYSLCEINASCVSPFPESAVPFIIEEVRNRIKSSPSLPLSSTS